jgi:Kef-type K+ transport system membrane component KefB
MIALWAIGGGFGYVGLMLTLGKKALAGLGDIVEREGKMSQNMLGTVMLILFAGAWFTDAVGIYAVFGAFVMGVAMPRGLFASEIRTYLERSTVGLFLPFFFVYSGLNTHVGSLNSPALWISALLLMGAAIVGKFGGCYVAARISGEPHRESMAIGTLMNSRGLMELIILNIGLQQKVITTQLFTIMILMAIVTTVMAAPLFEKIYGKQVAELKGLATAS